MYPETDLLIPDLPFNNPYKVKVGCIYRSERGSYLLVTKLEREHFRGEWRGKHSASLAIESYKQGCNTCNMAYFDYKTGEKSRGDSIKETLDLTKQYNPYLIEEPETVKITYGYYK